MEALITKIGALIKNFCLATYIIAGSAVGIGVNLFVIRSLAMKYGLISVDVILPG